MRLVLMSDTHGYHADVKVPEGDVLVHAGDYTRGDLGRAEFRSFLQWLEARPHVRKILVSGNHDGQSQLWPDLARAMIAEYAPSVTYLQDNGVEIDGVHFWGSPYTPTFYNWFHMRDRGPDIRRHWDLIPDDIDVLVTHGPAYRQLDWSNYSKEHVGCRDLYEAILRVRPKAHVCGHVHGGYGTTELVHDDGSKTQMINSSVCNEQYKPVNAPWVFEV